MNIPQRSQHRIFTLPGPLTLLGFIIFVVLIGTMTSTGFAKSLSEPMLILLFVIAFIPTWIGAHFDRKARTKRMAKLLEDHGFVPIDTAELDPEFLNAAQNMKPTALKAGSIKSAVVGAFNDHEVIICEHIVGHGRYKQYLMSCAVWTPYDWPKTLIRPRNLLDRVRSTQDLGIEQFDKQREIVSDDLDCVASMLTPMVDWFYVEKLKAMSFRMMPPSGLAEQWIFDGHWVIHADRGRANPKSQIQMPEFLTTFIKQIELHTQGQ